MDISIDSGMSVYESWVYDRQGNLLGQTQVRPTTKVVVQKTPTVRHRNPIISGFRAPSPWSMTKPAGLLFSSSYALLSYQAPYARTVAVGDSADLVPIPEPPAVQDNALWTKLRNAIAAETLDVAMVLGEMQGTVSTIHTGLMRLGRSLSAVKRRHPESFYYLLNGRRRDNRRPTDKFLRESAGVYLEWKYGIMPVVFDIEGGVSALSDLASGTFFGRAPIMTARAREIAKSETATPVRTKIEYFQTHGTVQWLLTREKYARADYEVDCEALYGLRRYGIGLSSLATLAFERTPFSFVLNMAIPIAEIIKAWGALAGVRLRAVSVTDFSSAEATLMAVKPSWTLSQGISVNLNSSRITPKASWFVRTPLSTIPLPMPYIRNPVKTGNMSTVLALFTQLRKNS